MTDEELMNNYICGDLEAFNELYSRHKSKAYGFICNRVQGDLRDDIFQMVFVRLHQKRHLYSSEYPFLPWFFTLIKHVIIDEHRKKKVELVELNFDIATIIDSSARDEVDALSIDVDKYELLYQKFVEGKGYKELQEEFKASASTLRKRVSRMLKEIRGSRS